MPPFDQIVGPVGALVLAVAALAALARDHVTNDRLRREEYQSNIDFERIRTAAAEARLDTLGGLLKDATNVMDRSVTLAEKVIDRAGKRE